jgi:hypothetical protein
MDFVGFPTFAVFYAFGDAAERTDFIDAGDEVPINFDQKFEVSIRIGAVGIDGKFWHA